MTIRPSLKAIAGSDVQCRAWQARRSGRRCKPCCAGEQGAARVVGLDVSEKMLERAVATTSDAAVSYVRADLERLELAEERDRPMMLLVAAQR
ncbi:methyltransferase family protein [Collimonas sp. PA-H2]|nr:methyltransferase family protein [Collimonas sp. PA-H2]